MVRRDEVLSRRAAREQLRLLQWVEGVMVRTAFVFGIIVLAGVVLALATGRESWQNPLLGLAIGSAASLAMLTLAVVASLGRAVGELEEKAYIQQRLDRDVPDLEERRRTGRREERNSWSGQPSAAGAVAAPTVARGAAAVPRPAVAAGTRRVAIAPAAALAAYQAPRDQIGVPDYGSAARGASPYD